MNNAGAALMSRSTLAAMTDHLQLEAEIGALESLEPHVVEIASATWDGGHGSTRTTTTPRPRWTEPPAPSPTWLGSSPRGVRPRRDRAASLYLRSEMRRLPTDDA